jgi:hypothetical protein
MRISGSRASGVAVRGGAALREALASAASANTGHVRPGTDRREGQGCAEDPKTQQQYIRHVKKFADFVGRSAEKATPEDVRRYQVWLASIGTRASRRQQLVQPRETLGVPISARYCRTSFFSEVSCAGAGRHRY